MFCFASFLFPGSFSCFLWVFSSPKIEREVITRDEPRSKKKRRRERQTHGRQTQEDKLFLQRSLGLNQEEEEEERRGKEENEERKKRQVKYPKEFEGKIKQ